MTDKQRIFFFRLFVKACAVRGLPCAEHEAYRHALIAEACPTSGGSLRCVGTGEDFDQLMRAVSRAAQSVQAVNHFSTAQGRRIAKMCEALVAQIRQIDSGLPEELRSKSASRAITTADYLRAILEQAGWQWAILAADDTLWLDLTLPHAQKLMMMLDTHRRRLLKRACCKRERDADGSERRMRLTFDLDSTYRWQDGTLWREEQAPEPEHLSAPPLRVRIIA